jgi:hypothetical protein
MATQSSLAQYFRNQWYWILLVLFVGLGVGVLFDYLYAKAFEETYRVFAQSHSMPDYTAPASVRHLASSFAVFSAGAFVAFMEMLHYSIHLQQQLLKKLEIDDESSFRFWKRLLDRFDPVDEATVKELRADLPYVTDYFGSITHVNARSWFAGENYLTLLLLQAHELLRRKQLLAPIAAGNGEPQQNPPPLELFRIVVWKDKWFNQQQSMALLRIFYFFLKDFEIPLKTYILTQRRFDRLLKNPNVPQVAAKEIEIKGQFWVCKKQRGNAEELSLVYGKKERKSETEIPHRVDDQNNCEQLRKMLDYLKNGSLPLESVFTDPGVMYDDEEVRRKLRSALERLESPVPEWTS